MKPKPYLTIAALALLVLCPKEARAQFTLSAEDPASVRWSHVSTSSFDVIYPRGYDTLGLRYLKELEKYKTRVYSSTGMLKWNDSRTLPVVLHSFNAASNGVVTWTPSRMELYTIPEWRDPSAMPWHTMLAIHEGRHAAQMQNGYHNALRPFGWFFGEIIPGVIAAWPTLMMLEGDAVVAATALSKSGRGRSAKFLNYFMYSLDNGYRRPWIRWEESSIYNVTTGEYPFGYMIVSGVRCGWDNPEFFGQSLDYISRRPYNIFPFATMLRKATGKGQFSGMNDVLDVNYKAWAADTLARKPYAEAKRITAAPKRAGTLSFSDPVNNPFGGTIWTRKDPFSLPVFVNVDTLGGVQEHIFPHASSLYKGRINSSLDGSVLMWNEIRRDPRWGQQIGSVIRTLDITSGVKRRIGGCKSVYVSPIHYGKDTIAAVQYQPFGGEQVVFLKGRKGRPVGYIGIPDSLQVVHIASNDSSEVFAAAISDEGFGIYKSDNGSEWETLLPPVPVQVGALRCIGKDALTFESDHNGSWEMYRLDLRTRALTRLTSSKYGGEDYLLLPDGSIEYSAVAKEGSAIYRIAPENALSIPVEWSDYHHYAIADKMSAQEEALLAKTAPEGAEPKDKPSAPRKYSKAANAFRFHSWAPCYVDINAISDLSFDAIGQIASLGVMAFFQNSASTLSGSVGYKAAPTDGTWYHSGHLTMTYSGLYPVFEGQFHIGDGLQRDYYYDEESQSIRGKYNDAPYISASLSSYIPLSWDDGVTVKGLVPSVGVSYSNSTWEGRQNVLFQAGLRGYVMQRTPAGCVYPRLGIGAEVKWADVLAYGYFYGYLPGGGRGQGIKLSYLHQRPLRDDTPFLATAANMLPRGLSGNISSTRFLIGDKLTFDYAFPFYMGDWRILDAFLCTRGIITPFIDFTSVKPGAGDLAEGFEKDRAFLASFGISFQMDFSTFCFLRDDVSVGVYVAGNDWSTGLTNMPSSPFSVGFIFDIDL